MLKGKTILRFSNTYLKSHAESCDSRMGSERVRESQERERSHAWPSTETLLRVPCWALHGLSRRLGLSPEEAYALGNARSTIHVI